MDARVGVIAGFNFAIIQMLGVVICVIVVDRLGILHRRRFCRHEAHHIRNPAQRPYFHLRRDDGFAGAELGSRRRQGSLLFAGVATREFRIELAKDGQDLRLADLVEEDIRARPPVFGGIDLEQSAKLRLEAVSAIAGRKAGLKALADRKGKPCRFVGFVELTKRLERAETVIGACPIAWKTGTDGLQAVLGGGWLGSGETGDDTDTSVNDAGLSEADVEPLAEAA